MSAAAPQPGDVLGGKFRVQQLLGEGGMGVVVAAHHLALDCPVALKFMHGGAPAGAAERFLREGRAAARLTSEHVCRVLDSGTFENGAPYLAMEMMEGTDLGRLLQRRGPLPYAEAVEYVLQACEPLAEAHAKGIVHRDLKPDNLFVIQRRGRPFVKVLDFGIAKAAFAAEMTGTGAMMGTPHYMSPEQFRSAGEVDARADIWSFGVILYYLVTGRVPFDADNIFVIGAIVTTEPHTPMHVLRPGTPPALEKVVARCLAKNRDDRYANILELLEGFAEFTLEGKEALSSVSRMLGVISKPIDVSPQAHRPVAPKASTTLGASVGQMRGGSRQPSMAIWAAGGTAIVGFIIAIWLRSGTTSSPAAPPHQPASTSAPTASIDASVAVSAEALHDAGVANASLQDAAPYDAAPDAPRREPARKPATTRQPAKLPTSTAPPLPPGFEDVPTQTFERRPNGGH